MRNKVLYITLLSLLLSGCNSYSSKYVNKVTKDEFTSFINNKNLEKEYTSASFTFSYKLNYKTEVLKEKIDISMDGKIKIYDENQFIMSYEQETKVKRVFYERGKEINTSKITEKVVTFTDEENMVVSYEDFKSVENTKTSKKTIDRKIIKESNEISNSYIKDIEILINIDILDFENYEIYIDDDDFSLINSYSGSIEIIDFKFDNAELKEIEYIDKSAYAVMKSKIVYEDVGDISIPSNSSDYKDLRERILK